MIEKRILCPERVRKIGGSFAFVEHRFLREGFWASLAREELLLYLLLVLVADRSGVSYYGYDKLCDLLEISADTYIVARNGLIDKDLLAFEAPLFQVLSLPPKPVRAAATALRSSGALVKRGLTPLHQVFRDLLR
jgi:hypothetical protein